MSSPFSPPFTPYQQDRQARGKNPYVPHDRASVADGSPLSTAGRRGRRVEDEWDSYEMTERRRWAATILGSPELLRFQAEARGDTLPSTRHHFNKILCGFDSKSNSKSNNSNDDDNDDDDDDDAGERSTANPNAAPRAYAKRGGKRGKGKQKEKEKDKENVRGTAAGGSGATAGGGAGSGS